MYFCWYFGHVSVSIYVPPFIPFWYVSSKDPCSHLHKALFVSENIVAYMQSSFVLHVSLCVSACIPVSIGDSVLSSFVYASIRLYLHVSRFVSACALFISECAI